MASSGLGSVGVVNTDSRRISIWVRIRSAVPGTIGSMAAVEAGADFSADGALTLSGNRRKRIMSMCPGDERRELSPSLRRAPASVTASPELARGALAATATPLVSCFYCPLITGQRPAAD